MFTPPPSPNQPRKEKETPAVSEKYADEAGSDDDGQELLVPYHDDPLAPTIAPGPAYSSKKSAKRRIWIPVIAVLLVLLAANLGRGWTSEPDDGVLDDVRSQAVSPPQSSSSMHSKHHQRHKRQTAASSPDASGVLYSSTTTSTSPTATDTPPAIQDPPLPVPTPFPQSFDTTFSNNFTTSSCQSFFSNSILSNLTYRQCRPFSLLLPTSAAFFQAQNNLTLLTSIMGGTCNTVRSVDDCVATMGWLSGTMQMDTVCAKDIAAGNALVLEALNGFVNYEFMREAGCLVNQRTNSYCFVDAVASSSASDFYFYTLPLGTPLPNKTTPSCSACVQSLMGIYAAQAGNTSLDISKTYPAAAASANAVCGQQYATVVESENVGLRLSTAYRAVFAFAIVLAVGLVL